MTSTIIPPLFGDMESWIPDSDSWLGKQLEKIIDGVKTAFGGVVDFIKGFVDKGVDLLVRTVQSVRDFIGDMCEGVKSFFTYIK